MTSHWEKHDKKVREFNNLPEIKERLSKIKEVYNKVKLASASLACARFSISEEYFPGINKGISLDTDHIDFHDLKIAEILKLGFIAHPLCPSAYRDFHEASAWGGMGGYCCLCGGSARYVNRPHNGERTKEWKEFYEQET